ncbi:SulP family inorganic anion transporter [Variovorax sp. J22R133]|uniref:SulP family inorganic anion transporter n=1 Tax=Variovorax brevis TaxID=3053503 RepID=UPI002575696D|nr:SulP family inorganic anion transporter [Variovorax sp. J22R133]MDM0110869.1 SulP family inorganic anion transporter [Variovorax sp. J22R133]
MRGVALPLPQWLSEYKAGWLKADVIAGLIAAAVVIPKGLAYATIAGLPVQVGLYTVFIPMVIYALLGSSRPLSVSTTTTIAILTGTALAEVASGDNAAGLVAACATLTLLTGAILVVAGLLRLGFVANFISEPVLVGFKAGIGIVIVVDQLPKLLGIHVPKGGFFEHLLSIVQALPQTSVATLAAGAITVLGLVALEHFVPRAPAPLIAVAGGIAAMKYLGLEAQGVSAVGTVPTGLPRLTAPDVHLVLQLWPAAMGIALMSFAETIAAGRAFSRHGEPVPQPNRELLATGIANAGGALFGAMPAGGGTTQTAVNRLAGAWTQVAALVTAAAALGTALFLAPFIGLMPHATLAAVVIVYSVGLIKPAEFRAILKIRKTEFVWALVAMAGVVLLGTLQGIVAAIVVSLVALAYQMSDPPVYVLGRKPGTNVFRPRSDEHPEDETFPGLLILRAEGRIYFANAQQVGRKMQAFVDEAQPKVVLIDMGGVFDLEYSALKVLIEAEQRMRGDGIMLWLSRLNPGVLEVVQRSTLGDTLGRERMFMNSELAIARYQRQGAA